METNWYVYRHRRLDNNQVFYVGIGKAKNYFRAYSKAQRSKWWKSIVKTTKYEVEVLTNSLTKEEACELEIFLISEYGRKDCCGGTLVNMTDGGDGVLGKIHSEETKLKISLSNKGKHSLYGENNPNYGKPRSESSKEKQRLTMTGRVRSKDSRISQSNTLKEQYKNGKFHSGAKKVIDTSTGIIYISIKEAAEAFGIKANTLEKYLSGKLKNKTNLKYA